MTRINSFSHRVIGNILYDNLKEKYDIVLHKKSFIWGNICPDFEPAFSYHPHYINDSLDFVQKESKALTDIRIDKLKITKDYSKRIGVICHYYADFFCYAHSKYFDNNLISHIRYENGLHRYLIKKKSMIRGMVFEHKQESYPGTDAINSQVKKYQAEYLKHKADFEKDVFYTFKVCTEAVLSLVCSSHVLKPSFRSSSSILSHSIAVIDTAAMR